MDTESGHEQPEWDFQGQAWSGIVPSPVTPDSMDRQQRQNNEKEADHLIPKNMYGTNDSRDDVTQKHLCFCKHGLVLV